MEIYHQSLLFSHALKDLFCDCVMVMKEKVRVAHQLELNSM